MTVEYICDICRTRYESAESAIECEAVGIYKSWREYEKGTMFSYEHNGYVGVFSLAEDNEFPTNRHLGEQSWWACRAPGYPGDSIGKEKCGSALVRKGEKDKWIKYRCLKEEHIGNVEYERMVKFLRSQGITPRYYTETGELIVLDSVGNDKSS